MIDLKSMTDEQLATYKLEKSSTITRKELIELYLHNFRKMIELDDGILVEPRDLDKHDFVNFIVGLSMKLEAVVDKELVTDRALIKKINKFTKHDFRLLSGEFTTQEEIDMINDILNDVIDYLQNIVDQKREEEC